FEVKELTATAADGSALEVEPGDREIDLAATERAWLLGRFIAPDDADDRVHVLVMLDDFGGFADPDGAGLIDARRAPLEFDLTLARLSDPDCATIHLDVARSLIPSDPTTRRLLPQLTLLY